MTASEVIELLLDYGADLNSKLQNGATQGKIALYNATAQGLKSVWTQPMKMIMGNTPLIIYIVFIL